MKYKYYSTHLEDWVQRFYKYLDIKQPDQLNILSIATKLNIWIHYINHKSASIERGGLWTIFLDQRLSPEEQWQDFGHELGHLLLQSGNQFTLPESFVLYQEKKANNFAFEFCIPSFMIFDLTLPLHMEAIGFISEVFHVTPAFAEKRLLQIENRIIATAEAKSHYFTRRMVEYS